MHGNKQRRNNAKVSKRNRDSQKVSNGEQRLRVHNCWHRTLKVPQVCSGRKQAIEKFDCDAAVKAGVLHKDRAEDFKARINQGLKMVIKKDFPVKFSVDSEGAVSFHAAPAKKNEPAHCKIDQILPQSPADSVIQSFTLEPGERKDFVDMIAKQSVSPSEYPMILPDLLNPQGAQNNAPYYVSFENCHMSRGINKVSGMIELWKINVAVSEGTQCPCKCSEKEALNCNYQGFPPNACLQFLASGICFDSLSESGCSKEHWLPRDQTTLILARCPQTDVSGGAFRIWPMGIDVYDEIHKKHHLLATAKAKETLDKKTQALQKVEKQQDMLSTNLEMGIRAAKEKGAEKVKPEVVDAQTLLLAKMIENDDFIETTKEEIGAGSA